MDKAGHTAKLWEVQLNFKKLVTRGIFLLSSLISVTGFASQSIDGYLYPAWFNVSDLDKNLECRNTVFHIDAEDRVIHSKILQKNDYLVSSKTFQVWHLRASWLCFKFHQVLV